MQRLIFILAFLFSLSTAFAQSGGSLSKKEQRKLLKEERKRVEAEKEARTAKMVDLMMNSSEFVLEADMLYDRYGQSSMVQSTINFLLVDSLYGVIQVGSPMYLGQNGVGGVTIEGEVSDYDMTKNEKRNTYQVSYMLRSPVGTYSVTMSVSANGSADARVSGSFSGSLRYSGKLIHPSNTRVYQGTSF